MSLKASLIAAAISLPPPWYAPGKEVETEGEYRARVAVIAEAIALEAQSATRWSWGPRSLAFAVLTKFYEESRFALEVHDGTKRGDEGRAICLGQHHRNGRSEEEWESLVGTDLDSTRRCVSATVKTLIAAQHYCDVASKGPTDENMGRVFALYGTGSRCSPTRNTRGRVARWRRLLDRY